MPAAQLLIYEALYNDALLDWLTKYERKLHRAYVSLRSLLGRKPQEAAR